MRRRLTVSVRVFVLAAVMILLVTAGSIAVGFPTAPKKGMPSAPGNPGSGPKLGHQSVTAADLGDVREIAGARPYPTPPPTSHAAYEEYLKTIGPENLPFCPDWVYGKRSEWVNGRPVPGTLRPAPANRRLNGPCKIQPQTEGLPTAPLRGMPSIPGNSGNPGSGSTFGHQRRTPTDDVGASLATDLPYCPAWASGTFGGRCKLRPPDPDSQLKASVPSLPAGQ